MIRKEILEVALSAAKEAGRIMKEIRASGNVGAKFKEVRDPVTEADTQAEAVIISRIKAHFPEHFILSEETNKTLTREMLDGSLWVIDPVDGTTNYSRGHAHTAVSIAYVERGETLVGVVFAPFLDEMYHATSGEGAYCNGTRIHVAGTQSLEHSLVATGFPYQRGPQVIATLGHMVEKVLSTCWDIRRLGAASLDLCWIASGKIDIYYETVKPWDIAAGVLMVKEAGGKIGWAPKIKWGDEFITDLDLPDSLQGENIVVAAPGVFGEFMKLIESKQ